MKIYKYITILLILALGIYCACDIAESLSPDTYIYSAVCFFLAVMVWGSDCSDKQTKKKAKKHHAQV